MLAVTIGVIVLLIWTQIMKRFEEKNKINRQCSQGGSDQCTWGGGGENKKLTSDKCGEERERLIMSQCFKLFFFLSPSV